ncbi:MAG TPA: (2Fe-2S) ferredoxin domain-containing protein [Candidatus Thermoplasmatota archaeon]|nr:(2Fe-2S) ferredoxin domain-containing protein [Candidatus Thermoplasmatota archaeon]
MGDEGLERPYERHVFVCTAGPWCRKDGPVDAIRAILKDGVKEAGLRDEVRVNAAGCLNQCGHGPNLVVYPEGVWYAGVDEEGARRILEEHVKAGRAVEPYRFRPARKGNNKLPWIVEEDRKKKSKE